MVAERVGHLAWQRPGCDSRCERVKAIQPGFLGRITIESHDPIAHEEYGRLTGGPVRSAVIRTGPLVIDRWARTVTAYGRDVLLTGREWDILDYLAANLGRCCRLDDVRAGVWGAEAARYLAANVVGTHLARLRAKLGGAGDMIETRMRYGIRLRDEPPFELRPSDEPPVSTRPWSRDHTHCVCCRSNERPHMGHGRCSKCQMARPGRRSRHSFPCVALPAEGAAP